MICLRFQGYCELWRAQFFFIESRMDLALRKLPSCSSCFAYVNILRLLSIKSIHFLSATSAEVSFIICNYYNFSCLRVEYLSNSNRIVIRVKNISQNTIQNMLNQTIGNFTFNELQQQMDKQQKQKKPKAKIIGGYELLKRIGTGTFAFVKEAIHIKSKQKVAVKILRKKLIVDSRDKLNLSRELRIIQKLRHPNIVQLYEILENSNKIYLVMEYVEGGELFDMIVNSQKYHVTQHRNRLEQEQASIIFQQLISTIQYLHSLGVAHRDIKPQNILITKNNTIKLIDFGLSCLYQTKQQLSTACGSPCYAAPEMLKQSSYNPLGADLWSCGIVLYTMLVGYLPFQHQNTSQLYKLIEKGIYDQPSHLSRQAKDMLRKLLQVQPQKRPSISQIRSHYFCSSRQQPIILGLLPNEKINIDLDIIQQMKNLGYSGFIKDVEDNILNENTAAFYLLLKKKLRQNHVTSEQYYKKILQKKEPFRSKSNFLKIYEEKNPEQLPLIKTRVHQSSNNINRQMIINRYNESKNRPMSSSKIRASVRIKRVLK